MEIIWEDGASKQLQAIVDYYLQVAGVRVAEKAVYITGIWPCRKDPEKLKSIVGEK